MAYKFQFGQAILSGALDQEGDVDILDSGVLKMAGSTAIDASRNATLVGISGSGDLTISKSKFKISDVAVNTTAAELNFNAGATAGTAVASKTVVLDANKDVSGLNDVSMADLTAVDISGSGDLKLSQGKLKISDVAVTSTAAELNFLDGAAANSVQNSKAVIYGASGEVAGTLSTAAQPNITSVGELSALSVSGNVDLGKSNGATITAVGRFDSGLIPSTDNAQDLGSAERGWANLYAEQGKFAGISGSLEFALTASQGIAAFSYTGGSTAHVAMDISTISTVLTGSGFNGGDSIAIFDLGVGQKKATIADLAKHLAGSGLSADTTTGVISTQAGEMNVFTSAGALEEGYNVQAATASMTMTMPQGQPGDVVVVKAGNLAAGQALTINRNGGAPKNMDGQTSLLLESPFAAVSLVYASDALGWRIV